MAHEESLENSTYDQADEIGVLDHPLDDYCSTIQNHYQLSTRVPFHHEGRDKGTNPSTKGQHAVQEAMNASRLRIVSEFLNHGFSGQS